MSPERSFSDVLVAARPVGRHARLFLAQHGEDLFDLFVVDHLAESNTVGVVAGTMRVRSHTPGAARGTRASRRTPLWSRAARPRPRRDGIDDLVTDFEHHAPRLQLGAGRARTPVGNWPRCQISRRTATSQFTRQAGTSGPPPAATRSARGCCLDEPGQAVSHGAALASPTPPPSRARQSALP